MSTGMTAKKMEYTLPRNFKSRYPTNMPSDAQKMPCVVNTASMTGTTLLTVDMTEGSLVSKGHTSGIDSAIMDKQIPMTTATL
mmetsp:Transcript_7915/g.14908  ORF Transcript_7915/g.14908 Transcript_7915/m.14908 type:complete len:83 (-) Transcript_7915:964-1212(-)